MVLNKEEWERLYPIDSSIENEELPIDENLELIKLLESLDIYYKINQDLLKDQKNFKKS